MGSRAFFRAYWLICALSVWLGSCAPPQPFVWASRLPPTDDKAAAFRIGPGDEIYVLVADQQALSGAFTMGPDGSYVQPVVGNISLNGLTTKEAAQQLTARLSGILVRPQVTVTVTKRRPIRVSVLGQVQKPGRFPLETTNTRVSDMLAAAGGVTPMGDDTLIVTGTRNAQPFRKVIDIPGLFINQRNQDDILLAGGDTIYVNKAPVYYIYGEAQRPGPYRIERNMTVQQALAQGGGPTPRGSTSRLRLTRTGPDGRKVEMDAKLSDPVLPNDVIYVRESLF